MPFPEGDAPAALRDATSDIAGRLRTVLHKGFTTHDSPYVKALGQQHHYRHRWRLMLGEGLVSLSRSTHHREGGPALPYLWIQGRPALVGRVASMFAP